MNTNVPRKWTSDFHNKSIRARIEKQVRIYQKRGPQISLGRTMPDLKSLIIGEAKTMTAAVLFFDLAKFTKTTSALSPENTLFTLNLIIPSIMDIVRHWRGEIEKNTGDGIMAIFGTETRYREEIAKPAIEAAMAIRYVMLNDIKPSLDSLGLPPLDFRIGIDMDELLIARIGINNHSFLTAVGDAANRASKLQSLAETNGICIGDNLFHTLSAELKQSCEPQADPEWDFYNPGTAVPYRYFNFSHHLDEPVKVAVKPETFRIEPPRPVESGAVKFFPTLLSRR